MSHFRALLKKKPSLPFLKTRQRLLSTELLRLPHQSRKEFLTREKRRYSNQEDVTSYLRNQLIQSKTPLEWVLPKEVSPERTARNLILGHSQLITPLYSIKPTVKLETIRQRAAITNQCLKAVTIRFNTKRSPHLRKTGLSLVNQISIHIMKRSKLRSAKVTAPIVSITN